MKLSTNTCLQNGAYPGFNGGCAQRRGQIGYALAFRWLAVRHPGSIACASPQSVPFGQRWGGRGGGPMQAGTPTSLTRLVNSSGSKSMTPTLCCAASRANWRRANRSIEMSIVRGAHSSLNGARPASFTLRCHRVRTSSAPMGTQLAGRRYVSEFAPDATCRTVGHRHMLPRFIS